MRFTIIYLNHKSFRDDVIRHLLTAIHNGYKLDEQSVRHPLFSTTPNWPNQDILYNIPLQFQCEEFEFLDGSLRTLRTLVIDAEVIESAIQSQESQL